LQNPKNSLKTLALPHKINYEKIKKTSIFLKLIFDHIHIIFSGTVKETVLKGIVDVITSDPTFKRVACLVHTSVPFKTLSEQQSEL